MKNSTSRPIVPWWAAVVAAVAVAWLAHAVTPQIDLDKQRQARCPSPTALEWADYLGPTWPDDAIVKLDGEFGPRVRWGDVKAKLARKMHGH